MDIATVLPTVNAKWKLSEVDGLVKFQNVANSLFIAKGAVPYVNLEGADASVSALVLNETGDGFYIKPVETTQKRGDAAVYVIQFSADDIYSLF